MVLACDEARCRWLSVQLSPRQGSGSPRTTHQCQSGVGLKSSCGSVRVTVSIEASWAGLQCRADGPDPRQMASGPSWEKRCERAEAGFLFQCGLERTPRRIRGHGWLHHPGALSLPWSLRMIPNRTSASFAKHPSKLRCGLENKATASGVFLLFNTYPCLISTLRYQGSVSTK